MKFNFYILLLILVLAGCSPKVVVNQAEQSTIDTLVVDYNFDINNFEVIGNIQPFLKELKIDTLDAGLYLVNLNLYTDFPSALPKFNMAIKFPIRNIQALWSSRTWSNNSFITKPSYCRVASDFNIVSGISNKSINNVTLCSYDMYKNRYIGIDVIESKDSISFKLNFFKDEAPSTEILEYKAQVLVDLRNENYSTTIRNSSQWLLDKQGDKAITKVSRDLQPVYSLWYPMYKNVPLKNITHYFDSVSAMGFKSILFDDGWQNVVRFDVDTLGYWDPSKATQVKDLITKAHESKMKVSLWYSLPFLGGSPMVQRRFSGKYLQYRATNLLSVLDIRNPDVRNYTTTTYKNIVKEWPIDGIWFDFLNGYYPGENVVSTEDKGRDFVSVRKSLDSLRILMGSEIKSINPELSINQCYPAVGPLHVSNLQSINGFIGEAVLPQVREKMVNNRLIYGDFSPFMEIMGVAPTDAATLVARKFHSVFLGTPYVSYFSYTLPEESRLTLKFWLNYWNNNYSLLMESNFIAYDPIKHYPLIEIGNFDKQIFVVYEKGQVVDLKDFEVKDIDLINSTSESFITITGIPSSTVGFVVYDHTGKYKNRGVLKFKRDVAIIEIPVGGFAKIMVN